MVAMVQKDLQEHDEWYNHVDEAKQWSAANDASRAAHEAAILEDDSAAMLEVRASSRYQWLLRGMLQ